jgi:hypothetical protein
MTFEEYFRLEGVSEEEQYLRFFVGLAPARLQSGYLIDPGAIDVFARKGPSTAMGCELCAGAAATQVLKMLLKRGKVVAAPWGLQFDAYANRLAKTWRPGGNNNPLQKLAISIGKKQLLQKSKSKKKATYRPVTAAERVLDLARWAPSGDNTQPWRFELVDENALVVHGSDTRDTVVYDLDGRASQMAIGALLESIEIAASTLGLRARILQRPDLPEQTPTFDVTLCMDESLEPDPLAPYLKVRSVQRRPMSTRPLTATERAPAPNIASPTRLRNFPSSINVWAEILTLVAESVNPIKTASTISVPNKNWATAHPRPSGTRTPRLPARAETLPERNSSGKWSSRPASIINSKTPISAVNVIDSSISSI